jgi:3-deoxy-D-manno-octulosonate 8-phosphate phosphatase (KDO 8-P phosphatase)
VDGVLTNGIINITTEGEMIRRMNVKDGFALKTALQEGFRIAIISGGTNEGVRRRLNGLGIKDIYLGVHNKLEVLESYCREHSLKPEEIMYMGDDIPDWEVMRRVGLPCAPNDADSEIQRIAKYISHKKGGEGCARDIIEQILRVQGKWFEPELT